MSRLRSKLVQFQVKAAPSDHFTEEEPSWQPAFAGEKKSYAAIHPLRGDELFQAQQKFGQVSHKLVVDYKESITSEMRILWGSRVLHIAGIINPREANRSLELMCLEQT